MAVRFVVFLATSLDGYIARENGGLDWLDPYTEDHGYTAFYDGVEAVVIGRGTYDTVLGFPGWAYGKKRVIVCTKRPAAPKHGEEIPLRLAESKRYDSGLVQSRYLRK